MGENLKFIVFGRSSGGILSGGNARDVNESKLMKEAEKVFQQLKNINLGQLERQKVNTGNGSWYCYGDDQEIFYLLLSNSNYPERHAYACINQLIQHFQKLDENYQNLSDDKLTKGIKHICNDLLQKYDDLKSIDKLANAQASVNQVQLTMENNIKGMLQSQETLNNMGTKAEEMRSQAYLFNKQSTDLQKIMYYRNLKLKIMIAMLSIAGILYVTLPIIASVKSATS